MKVGDLIQTIDPGLDCSLGFGIILETIYEVSELIEVVVLWDAGHISKTPDISLLEVTLQC